MSWDISIQKFPDVASITAIPDDYVLEVIGPRDYVITRITEAVPSANFEDPTWGIIEGDGWSIEVNIGEELACTGFMLHVRGGGDEVLRVIASILEHTGLRGLDCSSGDFFDLEESRETFGAWQDYRDQIRADPVPKRSWFSRLFGG